MPCREPEMMKKPGADSCVSLRLWKIRFQFGDPDECDRLIEELAALPGIGGKSAQRLAFYLINLPF